MKSKEQILKRDGCGSKYQKNYDLYKTSDSNSKSEAQLIALKGSSNL